MKPPLTILFVYGDGPRVGRIMLPRWVAHGLICLLAAIVLAMAGVSSHYAFLLQDGNESAALRQALDAQRDRMALFRTRVASVRNEILAWKGIHAKIRESFGPDAAKQEPPTGVGGRTPLADAPEGAKPGLGNELRLLAMSVAEEDQRLRDLEPLMSRTGKLVSSLPLRWPVRGPLNSGFGTRRSPWTGVREHHDGVDIGSLAGTPVKSPAAGRVMASGAGGSYGRYVKLDHGNGVRSLYGHLSKIEVKIGQHVEKGDVIGLVGSTGRSTGPHLHYEVHVDGKAVDPRSFLWNG
jgi:murein DD-endopeptidase MepM/ murein hydrolase activator NlpD